MNGWDHLSTLRTAFSTPAEIHSFVIGFYWGLMPHRGIPSRVPTNNSDVHEEIHYARGGYVAGELSKYGLLFGAGSYGVFI